MEIIRVHVSLTHILVVVVVIVVVVDPLSKVQGSTWLLQLGRGAVFLRTVGGPLLPDTQVKDR